MPHTVANYTQTWLEIHACGLAPATKRCYATCLRLHILPRIGGRMLEALTPADVLECLAPLCERGQTRAAQLTLITLRAALGDAQRLGLISSNPAALVRAPRHERRPTAYWQPEELSRFLAAQRGQELYAVWLLAACCGLRRGELLGLRWEDVDLRSARIHIRRQRVPVEGRIIESPPKSAAGRRSLALAPPVAASLASLRRRSPWAVYVLCHPSGEPYSAQELRHALDAAASAAGLPHIGLHGLRHSMAAAAVAAGVELRTLQQIMGHAHVATTADIYAHVSPETSAAALRSISEILL